MPNETRLEATPALIEGPYWKPNSPQRTRLAEASTRGQPLMLRGRVVSRKGRPLAGAWVDLWQCDGEGVYDNEGYRLRGHQYTQVDGSFTAETVVPSEYIDVLSMDDGVQSVHRTSHIHIKVKAPNRDTLTTQLYFPDEPYNAEDSYFTSLCLLDVRPEGHGMVAFFEVVLE